MKSLFVSLIMILPISSYLFLDQISVRRSEDFAYKWYAREAASFSDLAKLVSDYDDVIFASGDLDGIGIIKNGKITLQLGDETPDPSIRVVEQEAVSKRIGFLKYVTTIGIPNSDGTAVYFIFADDSAPLDFFLLVLAMAIVTAVVVIARRRMDQERTKIIQENTILTMRSFAHDFRAPFSKLVILMKLLQEKQDMSELLRFKDDLLMALQQADGMLYDFMNLDGRESEKQVVDVKEILNTLEKSYFKTLSVDLGISFTAECESDLRGLGSAQKSMRVLMNLLDNAFKHAKSRVAVRVSKSEHELLILVENDGPGIAQKDLSHIFEPFYTSREGGIGLGLFISLNFAKAQGGSIRCRSENNRTVFTFALPLYSQKANCKQRQKLGLPEAKTKTATIAFVDDEIFYRKLVSDALTKDGVQVDLYTNTDALLMALRDPLYKPELVLVDRFGPDFDVINNRFVESCRDYHFAGPIVLFSNSVAGHEKFDGIFRVMDKSMLLNGEQITTMINEFKNESQ